MAFVVRHNQGEDFQPAPEGVHNAICVDVIDMGMVQSQFGTKQKVRFVFELETWDQQQQRPFQVNEFFTLSLHKKSRLNQFLASWRGRALEEGEDIDLEKCIGVCALVVVNHREKDEKTYANINAIQRPAKRIAASGRYDPQAARQRMAQNAQQQRSNPANYQPRQQPPQQGQPRQQYPPPQQAPQQPGTFFNPPPQQGGQPPPAADFDVPQDDDLPPGF